ncbi:MAG: immunoglobulin domain-containing protein, partial [Verrucomicrobia bacterium]|nr:immunoglobulin domain-containing protein [Verrucomicrobiota bacterium]
LAQPIDTPVLEGSKATFNVIVNGPWPIQWLMNGQPITGARQTSYTTEPVTKANATNVYEAQIVGCEKSTPVKAVLFTPSATKSIGISFRGGGANGAPTLINSDDIAGIHQQAYWINGANAGSGSLPDLGVDPPALIVDSDNKESTVTFEWQASGSWGSGTGDASATQRMLNGLIYANIGSAATLTFGNVPAGAHTVIAYIVNIPLQFQEANFTINGQTAQTYYIRSMNADEYNAAPGFYRGSSTDAKNRTVASYVRFDNVRPNNGVITLTFDTVAGSYDRGSGLNGVQLILNAPPAGAPPSITADPQPAVAAAGSTVRLSVAATGGDLVYQWRKNGRNLPNGGNVSGATSSALTISSFSDADVAVYSVAVFNPGGSTISRNASVRLSKFDINDSLVGYWKLDESSGSNAANAAAGGKAGKITGSATWGAGQVGNALRFDGSTTYVFVDDFTKAKAQIGGSAWVNVAAGAASDVAFFRNAQGNLGVGVNARGASLAGQFEVGLVLDANDNVLRLSGAIGAGPNVVRATGPAAFPLGSWQHVAFSGDGAQLRLYLNGAEIASTDYITTVNPPDMPYISMGARLNLADPADPASGLGPDPTSPNFLAGQLDDVALWTRALTADEVSQVYTAGKAGQAVTTVKITAPPVTPPTAPTVKSERTATGLRITYTGTLQSADSVTGPWTDVASAQSPFNVTAAPGAKFYRVKQ